MDEPGATEDWWAALYDDRMADLFLVRSDADELRATVAFLRDVLGIASGSAVFDQCCGIGSLGLPLAQAGARVVGVDQSGAYIRRARRQAEALGVACDFHQGDAFAFVPPHPCDAAFNWGTSFGYAADDRRNALMLSRAFEALRPGGWFVLDYQNIARVLGDFRPCLVRRHETGAGELLLVRECALDLPRGTLDQRWSFVRPDGRRDERRSSVRLYLPHALAALLAGCGFSDITFFGGVRGEALTPDSPRCIARARRPGP